MKQYVYTEQELGLEKFSDGTLRLNLPETRDPDEADVFVVPEALFKFTDKDSLMKLKWMHYLPGSDHARIATTPERHVFLDLSEHFTTYRSVTSTCIFIRAALTRAMRDFGPNSISWPWPVEDYADCVQVRRFECDVTFHGWLSGLVRKASVRSCQSSSLITSDIASYNNFYGYQNPEEQLARRVQYKAGMRRSRMVLTQQSIPGVLPYRFYEAMSAGRCQLYIGHDYELPFADKIDYNDFVSFLNTDSADEAARAVKEWVTRYSDDAIKLKGLRAREAWDQWLRPDKWVDLMTYAVTEKVKQI